VVEFRNSNRAALPNSDSMNLTWPTMSSFASHRTCPLRTMFIASYPSMVLRAPSTDRNQRLATMPAEGTVWLPSNRDLARA